jgi:uncharacterized protein (TIGR03437 family)
LFVSQGQINAQLPYELPKGSYQVIVQRGTTISTPESVVISDGQPAVFTIAVVAALGRGLSFECGCFGKAGAGTIGAKKLAENVVLLALGVVAAVERR